MDVDRLLAEAYDGQTKEDVFRRFFLNQPSVRSNAWLTPVAWAACGNTSYQAPEGTRVVLAFDGSYRLDSSALVACTVEPIPYLWVAGLWERPDRAPTDWTIDRENVDKVVREAMDTYDVAELAFDPPGWHAEAGRWAGTYEGVVVAFPTSNRGQMAAACSRFYSAVMNHEIAHDGDPRLARHVANAVLKDTAQGGYVTKDGPNSPRKIDAAIARRRARTRLLARDEQRCGGGVGCLCLTSPPDRSTAQQRRPVRLWACSPLGSDAATIPTCRTAGISSASTSTAGRFTATSGPCVL
jgi:phage terminase large subunit-like protein